MRPTDSIAQITYFKAKPEKIASGAKTVLTWGVTNAASVEVDGGVGAGLKQTGRAEVSPQATTTYTLKALDDRGNSVTKSVTVTVTPPPAPADNGDNPAGAGNPPGQTPPPGNR